MLKNFLSFCSIPELHDRNPLSVSPLGELTNKTRTYCKDPNIYNSQTGGLAIINFYSKTETEEETTIPRQHIDKQLEICLWMLDQAKRGNFDDDQFLVLQQLKNQFTKDVEFTGIGEMVTNSAIYLPSFIEMKFKEGENDILAKIWFANEYFDSSYPYKEFEIDLPVEASDMDFLYENNYVDVTERMKAETPVVVEARITKITDNFTYPYTARFSLMFLLHDTINNKTVPLYFTVLIWGNPEDSDEQILAEIADKILANSKYDEEQWTPKLPDIFNPLEFVCVPHFELISRENKALETSTFSPIFDYESALTLPKLFAPNLTPEGLIKSLQSIPFMYKSVQVSFVGKPDNYDGKNKIKDIYPDYILVEVDNPDSGLMETDTLHFIKDMQTLISAAEVMTPTNLSVKGVRRLERWGKFYVAKRIGKVNFVMATRYQMIKEGILSE